MQDIIESSSTSESVLVPVVRSVAQSLLIERSMNVGSKLLQGKTVKDNDVGSLALVFIVFLISHSK